MVINMKTYDFIIRVHNYDRTTTLADIQNITISNITLVSKPQKFGGISEHIKNQKKFNYRLNLTKQFHNNAGSHSSSILWFTGKYIDIRVKNFPRFPVFSQDYYAAKNCLEGWGYTNYINKGFPNYLLYRQVEILNIHYK